MSSTQLNLQRGGLLQILDDHSQAEQSVSSNAFLDSLHHQHSRTGSYFKPLETDLNTTKAITSAQLFGVRHFGGPLIYDASEFLITNADRLSGDAVAAFDRKLCAFGFVSHLFTNELALLNSVQDDVEGAKSLQFRASLIYAGPPPSTSLTNLPSQNTPPISPNISAAKSPTTSGLLQSVSTQSLPVMNENISMLHKSALKNQPLSYQPKPTLTADFHNRLDSLLRTLVHARPHFVCCIRSSSDSSLLNFPSSVLTTSNKGNKPAAMKSKIFSSFVANHQDFVNRPEIGRFSCSTVQIQIRAMQLLPTARLMQQGLPHRMRYASFQQKYRCVLFEPTLCVHTTLLGSNRSRGQSNFASERPLPFVSPDRSYSNMNGFWSLRTARQNVMDTQDALHKCRSILLCLAEKIGSVAVVGETSCNGCNCGDCCKVSSSLNAATYQPSWAFGRRHLFFAERVRQQLDQLRTEKENLAATIIQSRWRGFRVRRQFKQQPSTVSTLPPLPKSRNQIAVIRPLNTSGRKPTSLPMQSVLCDEKLIEKTCAAFGLDYVRIFFKQFL